MTDTIDTPWSRRINRIAIIVALFLIAYGIYMLGWNVGKRAGNIAAPIGAAASVTQDPTLVTDATQLGINPAGVNLALVPAVNNTTDVTDGANIVGGFVAPNTISIKSGLDKSTEVQTVAYEFLHYYWAKTSAQERQQLTATYQSLYDSSAELRYLTQNYVGDADTLADERNSTACTLIDPANLTQSFNTYCNGLLPNRESVLFN